VDLEANDGANETLAQIKAQTTEAQQRRFDEVTASSFSRATFRGDHVVSAFETGGWLDTSHSPPAIKRAAWLVLDASGTHKFLVAFVSFHDATTSSPGTVVMHIKQVNG
jgi:hypothetical protein